MLDLAAALRYKQKKPKAMFSSAHFACLVTSTPVSIPAGFHTAAISQQTSLPSFLGLVFFISIYFQSHNIPMSCHEKVQASTSQCAQPRVTWQKHGVHDLITPPVP